MNKKIWVGFYVASFLLFLLAALTVGIVLLIQMDDVYQFKQDTLTLIIGLGVLAYLQFVLVQTVYNFLILAKMWGSIQDGATPVTVGKAIGFLFIPFFNIYWIFVAWGSFPSEYNKYIERHKLNAAYLSGAVFSFFPILILLTGIFVLPLLVMPIVFSFVVARTSDAVNGIKMAVDDRQKGIILPSRQEQAQTMKSKLIPAMVSALVIASFLFFTGFTVFAFRNLRPKATEQEIPETVGSFKRDYPFTNGSIFGLRSEYSATYKPTNAAKTSEGIYYRLIDFTRETDAVTRFKQRSYCPTDSVKKEGAIKDKSGNEIGEFKVCGAKNLYFRTKNRYVSLDAGYSKIGTGDLVGFYTNLPYNTDVDAVDLIASVKFLPSSTAASLSETDTGNNGSNIASGEKADATLTAEDFYKESDGANRTKFWQKYAGKIVEIDGRFYPLTTGISDSATLHAGKNTVNLKLEAASRAKVAELKKDERAVFKCRVAGSDYFISLENCALIEAKGVFSPDEKADYVFTAKDYFNEVDGDQPYESKSKKQALYAGKVIELTGKVKVIGDDKQYLEVGDLKWVICEPDEEKALQFANLVAGQEVKFKGLASNYGARLEHCIVVSE